MSDQRITVEVVETLGGPAYRVSRGGQVWLRSTLRGLVALVDLSRVTVRG